MKNLILKFTSRFARKRFVWTKYIKIYTDGGYPNFYWFPKLRRMYYNSYWEMVGFYIYWLGREVSFSFGEDKHKLYEK